MKPLMLAGLLLIASVASPPADLAAVGVVLSARPDRSVAILRSGDRTRIVSVGDTAFGGRVAAITATTVHLQFGTERVELPLSAESSGIAAAARRPEPPLDPATVTLRRAEVERRLNEETPRILAETTLVPVSQDGRLAGFALTRLPEGTLLTEAGLRPGDVLVRVNDVEIDSLATLIGLWPRLRTEREIRAVVLRNGQPVSLAVALR